MNRRQILAAMILLAGISSVAQAGTPGLDLRETRQRHRIVQGIESGALTARESARLIKGQRQLRRMEHRAKSDGVVTPRERRRLHRKADRESAKIAYNKHDAQTR